MYSDERSVIVSLHEGKITFSEAANMLNISKELVEEMLESFKWIPSSTRIAELCDSEREVLSDIRKEIMPIIYRSPNSTYNYKLISFNKPIFTKIKSYNTSIPDVPKKQEKVVVNYFDNTRRYKICN